MLPGETFDQPMVVGLSATDEKRIIEPHQNGVALMIAGCVDYILTNAGGHHQTSFVYELDQGDAAGDILSIDPTKVPIPPSELLFEINPGLAANAD